MRIVNYTYGLLIIVLAISCTKDTPMNQDEISEVKALLLGEWLWHKSFYPWTQTESSPDNTGIEKALIFTENDRVRTLINNQLESDKSYQLIYVNTNPFNPNQDSLLMLQIEGRSADLFSVTANELIIDATPYDGTRDYYKKRR